MGMGSCVVRLLTAKAVIVLRVLGLISAGMNARMKFGTLSWKARLSVLAL